MLTTIAGWLSGSLGTFLIGFLSRFFNDWLAGVRADKAQKEAGRLEAERDQLAKTLETQKEMDKVADRDDTEDDMMKRLENGTG